VPLFDRYLIVDWSAANAPTKGKDSIWTALVVSGQPETEILNHPTRSVAIAYLSKCIEDALGAGQRLFAGFDFAFGYPAGTTELPGKGHWEAVWSWLSEQVEDADDNRSNRFDIAAKLNDRFKSGGPFWGHPSTHAGRYAGLEARKPDYCAIGVAEKRSIDLLVPSAQPVWKLAYAGSVGSQSLLGIARLEKLRRGKHAEGIAIWPFQTGFADDLAKPVILAEVYPSLFDVVSRDGEVRDSAQVRTLAEGFRNLDTGDNFRPMLDGPRQNQSLRDAALSHEAWMVGFTDERLALWEDVV